MIIEIDLSKREYPFKNTPAWAIKQNYSIFPEFSYNVSADPDCDGRSRCTVRSWVRIEREGKHYLVDHQERMVGESADVVQLAAETIQRLINSVYQSILFYNPCGWEVEDTDTTSESDRMNPK